MTRRDRPESRSLAVTLTVNYPDGSARRADERVSAIEMAALSGAIGEGLDRAECEALLALVGALELDIKAERLGRWGAWAA